MSVGQIGYFDPVTRDSKSETLKGIYGNLVLSWRRYVINIVTISTFINDIKICQSFGGTKTNFSLTNINCIHLIDLY